MLRIIGISLAMLFSTPSFAEFAAPPALKMKAEIKPALKPNLVIDAFGWSGEFCGLYGCQAADQMRQELKINKATCALVVRVRNAGNAATGAFTVRAAFYHWKGDAQVPRDVSVGEGLAPGAVKIISIPAATIGYYHTGKPFVATVDFLNQVTESNEADNTATMNTP